MGTRLPFVLKKRSDRGGVYYVSFKSGIDGSTTATRSTGTKNKTEALATALGWYKNGIPEKDGGGKKTAGELEVIEAVRSTKMSGGTVSKIIREIEEATGDKIQRIRKGSKGAVNAYQFMLDFWDWDKSPYIREKLRMKHRIGKPHALAQRSAVKRFWKEILEKKTLAEVTRQDVWDFIDRQEEEDCCFQTKNDRIRAVTTALKWAFTHEYIETDISGGYVLFSGKYNEREILMPEMARAVFSFKWDDERAQLANAVAMCTGMRAHEIASLQLRDIGEGRLYVRHSWNAKDGLKPTKNGEARTVLLPFPGITDALRRLGETNPYGHGAEAFIFYASVPGKPLETDSFLKGLRKALVRIGVTEQTARKYTFHSWRHYFTTYMKGSVDDRALQMQTGHKDIEMLEHYASHRTAGSDARLMDAQERIFGEAVGALPGFSFDKKTLYSQIKTGNLDKSELYEHTRQKRRTAENSGADV